MNEQSNGEAIGERPRRWAKIKDVADYLGLSRWHVHRMISAGKLPAVRLGSRLRVDLGRVDALLESGALGAAPPAAPKKTAGQTRSGS